MQALLGRSRPPMKVPATLAIVLLSELSNMSVAAELLNKEGLPSACPSQLRLINVFAKQRPLETLFLPLGGNILRLLPRLKFWLGVVKGLGVLRH